MLRLLVALCAFLVLVNEGQAAYFYDSHHVRYELYQTNGGKSYNWLFLPGGPGADSRYLRSLVDHLELPGNVWLVDLPGNGDNIQDSFSDDFDSWMEIFPEMIVQFDNPVLVGHSFGGMFPLLFPEMEQRLKGYVILNSTPGLWQQEAIAYAKQFDLPDFSKEMQEFAENTNQQTFEKALDACMPYYFPKSSLEKGRALLLQSPMRFQPALWWIKKATEINFSAIWIPQNVPTLIIGAKYDCMTPFTCFQKDKRFKRSNIKMLFLKDAGHAPWIESPDALKHAFKQFTAHLSK